MDKFVQFLESVKSVDTKLVTAIIEAYNLTEGESTYDIVDSIKNEMGIDDELNFDDNELFNKYSELDEMDQLDENDESGNDFDEYNDTFGDFDSIDDLDFK